MTLLDPVEPELDPSADPVEWRATVRGREVRCRWTDGRLDGDPEVLARIDLLPAAAVDLSTPLHAFDTLRRVVLDPTVASAGAAAPVQNGRKQPCP